MNVIVRRIKLRSLPLQLFPMRQCEVGNSLLPPLWSSAAMKPSAWHILFNIFSCSRVILKSTPNSQFALFCACDYLFIFMANNILRKREWSRYLPLLTPILTTIKIHHIDLEFGLDLSLCMGLVGVRLLCSHRRLCWFAEPQFFRELSETRMYFRKWNTSLPQDIASILYYGVLLVLKYGTMM